MPVESTNMLVYLREDFGHSCESLILLTCVVTSSLCKGQAWSWPALFLVMGMTTDRNSSTDENDGTSVWILPLWQEQMTLEVCAKAWEHRSVLVRTSHQWAVSGIAEEQRNPIQMLSSWSTRHRSCWRTLTNLHPIYAHSFDLISFQTNVISTSVTTGLDWMHFLII